jgi:TusA-related sulfurtransferase
MMWLLVILGMFSYDEVLRTDLVAHAKIRWSRMDVGQRIVVEIDDGTAKRSNPNWSPEPEELAYDLGKERDLERVLKWAKLPAPRSAPSTSEKDRTLEILVENAKSKGYHSAGYWSMSVKAWQKGRYGSIFDALETLMNAKAELFEHEKGSERPSGFVPQ